MKKTNQDIRLYSTFQYTALIHYTIIFKTYAHKDKKKIFIRIVPFHFYDVIPLKYKNIFVNLTFPLINEMIFNSFNFS